MVQMNIVRDISALPEDMQGLATGLLERAKAMHREGSVPKPGASKEPEIPFVPEVCSYDVGGLKYEVREPVLEQERQLIRLLRETKLTGLIAPLLTGHEIELSGEGLEKLLNLLVENVDPFDFLEALGDSLARFYAIILTPEGTSVQDKDLDAVEKHLNGNLTFTAQLEVVVDFFALGRALIKGIAARLRRRAEKT